MTIQRVIEGHDRAILTCAADARVEEAVAVLAEQRIGALPIMDGDRVAGIFSERDVIYRLRELGPAVLQMQVREVMTAPRVTVEPDTSVFTALSLMTQRRVRHLPVMKEGHMVGFVSIGDLVKYRIDKIESEAEALRTYIQMA